MGAPYKTFSYHTFGCKVNFADSSYIARKLIDAGISQVPIENYADVCLINTCSVTDNADKKANKLIRSINLKFPESKIVVYGCYAQLKPEFISKIPGVTAVIGTEEKFNINNILSDKITHSTYKSSIENVTNFNISYSINERTRAFIKIQDGCNYNCSFCTIPLARGKSRSSTINDTVKEIQYVINHGIKEVVISGINLGDFGYQHNESLEMLLIELEKIKKLERYRLSSIEPNLLNENILKLMSASKKALPHLHIPLQSGSNRILKLMKRRYSVEDYQNTIKLVKKIMPEACIGVDVIIGFPTENDKDFKSTYKFLDKMDISYLHVFTYSKRENTLAENIKPEVDEKNKIERRNQLRLLSSKKYNNFIKKNIGNTSKVLFENISDGYISGWTENYIKVSMKANKKYLNQIKKVQLNDFNNNIAYGVLLNEA